MGCTESAPVAGDLDVPHKVDPSIPTIGGFPPLHEKTELIMREKVFSLNGNNFEIKTRAGHSLNGGIKIQGKALAWRGQMVLLDRQNAPIAVCLHEFQLVGLTYNIYTLKPLYQGQSMSDRNHEGKALYSYAKVVLEPFSLQKNVFLYNQSAPSYTIHRVGDLWPKKRAIRRQGVTAALVEGGTWEGNWSSYLVTICPGIDPCLIVCLVAIHDAMDEK